jgi:hypothetical protein
MSARDIFDDVESSKVYYRTRLQVRYLMVGGVPSDESVIRKWLEARMELDDTALLELLEQTIAERDAPMSAAEKVDALIKSPQAPSVNGFKRDPDTGELSYESRCLKAALKEAANSAFPGVNYPGKKHAVEKGWVGARKGLLSTFEEHVFVEGDLIGLGVKEPTRVEERIKRVMTPQGPRSAIATVEVIDRPAFDAVIAVHDDFLPREAWAKIWERCEDIGVGADRGRSDGRFELITWERI